MQNERKVLVSAVLRLENDGYSNLILDSLLKNSELNGSQKAFVTAAFYGVVERKITIDFILNKYLKKPIKKAPPITSAVLRSGAYQILFMDKVPNSAAVNEAVKIIKKSKEKGNAPLVNAVLRKLCDETVKSQISNNENPSVKFSVEEWIYNCLCCDYSKEKAEQFLENSLSSPPVYIRINHLKENAKDTFALELSNIGAKLCSTECEDVCLVSGLKGAEGLKSYQDGLFYVQDISSRLAVKALNAKSGERVLDCCAAPGGKSFSIALDMQNKGEIVSCDIHPHRVSLIEKGAKRLGLDIIKPTVCDGLKFNEDLGLFDKVICDAPCSGIGVIRRKPEIKYKSNEECLSLTEIQYNILNNAARYVKPGGRLIYSTCTLLKRENEGVVDRFLKANTNFKPVSVFDNGESCVTFMPPQDAGDGFFIAAMERV